ncbi:hypothetical protein PLD_16290 [Pseudomonas sp. LD120]|nr:hypothetical protein PLD_16290 [Pseudomonas sp. LD120]
MESAKRRSQRDCTLTSKLSVVDPVEKGVVPVCQRDGSFSPGVQGQLTLSTMPTRVSHSASRAKSAWVSWFSSSQFSGNSTSR